MNRTTRIASVLTLAGFLCMSTPPPTLAAGPELSGYGGPGAGEQTILGSTLLGGQGGSGGSSGSSGSGGATGATEAGSPAGGGSTSSTSPASGGSGGTTANGSRVAPGGSTGGTGSASGAFANAHGTAHTAAKSRSRGRAAAVGAYVYPSSLRTASADSSALAISGGDVLALIATIVALAALSVVTRRLVRLQR